MKTNKKVLISTAMAGILAAGLSMTNVQSAFAHDDAAAPAEKAEKASCKCKKGCKGKKGCKSKNGCQHGGKCKGHKAEESKASEGEAAKTE